MTFKIWSFGWEKKFLQENITNGKHSVNRQLIKL